ncbi:MAG: hypothetical protein QM750_27900 [Rubrivivax sp.]
MKTFARTLAVIGAATALLGFASPAPATPIIYQVSAIASGTIGAASFNDVLVTLTLTGDTFNVVELLPIPNSPVANLGTTTINIPGIGTASLTDLTEIFASVTPYDPDSPGFPVIPYLSIAILDNPPSLATNIDVGIVGSNDLLGYDLRTSIGPITGIGGLLFDPGPPSHDAWRSPLHVAHLADHPGELCCHRSTGALDARAVQRRHRRIRRPLAATADNSEKPIGEHDFEVDPAFIRVLVRRLHAADLLIHEREFMSEMAPWPWRRTVGRS